MIHPLSHIGRGPVLRDLQGYLIGVADNQLLAPQSQPWRPLAASELASLLEHVEHSHYVGQYQGQQCHVINLPSADIRLVQALGLEWVGLRSQLGEISDDLFQFAGRALQLVNWFSHHRFCGRCGAPTELASHEFATVCANCQAHYYPRISPCVIGIIERGEQCLLARHRKSRGNRFTALAGFVEPGESAEQALAREVHEEVGLQVKNIRYFASQPWPFPGQLMLAFHAEYAAGSIRVDQQEIEAAEWFDARQLPQLPPPGTISAQLIENFVRRVTEG